MCFSPYLEIRFAGEGGGEGWGPPMEWYTTSVCTFSPATAEKLKFPNFSF